MDSQTLQSLLGSNITRFRQLQSLTVEQLAEKSGVSTGHLMDVIHGRKWVSSTLLARVAEALSVPVLVLFDDGKSEQRSVETALAALGRDLTDRIGELIGHATKEHMDKRQS